MTYADLLHFEDFEPGAVLELGGTLVTRADIIAFAREFDPQPFHLDDHAANASLLGGLCASGWHVCGILMRLMVEGYLHRTAGMGSPGLDEVKWLKPVRPGDRVVGRATVLSKRVSAKRPEMGILTLRWELLDGAGQACCEMTGINLVKVRAP